MINAIALFIVGAGSFYAGVAIAAHNLAKFQLQNLTLKDDLRAIIAHADDIFNSPPRQYSESKMAELLGTIAHANANLIQMDEEQA